MQENEGKVKNGKQFEMPEKPVFSRQKQKDLVFLSAYSNKLSEAVVSMDGKNVKLSGNPKMVLRLGNSQFGDQLVFEFLIKEKKEEFKKRSDWDSIEWYLPIEYLSFLKDALNFFEQRLKE